MAIKSDPVAYAEVRRLELRQFALDGGFRDVLLPRSLPVTDETSLQVRRKAVHDDTGVFVLPRLRNVSPALGGGHVRVVDDAWLVPLEGESEQLRLRRPRPQLVKRDVEMRREQPLAAERRLAASRYAYHQYNVEWFVHDG